MTTAILAICFILKLLKRSSHHTPKIRRLPFNLVEYTVSKKRKLSFTFMQMILKIVSKISIRKDKY